MKLLQLLEAASPEPFVLSDGTKATADNYKSGSPNLSWRPASNPFIINRPRTKEDDQASKKFISDLEKNLAGYKKYLIDTNQMTPYKSVKEGMLKNADKVIEISKLFDSKVNEFNSILGKLNTAAADDNVEKFSAASSELDKLIFEIKDANKAIKSKMTIPAFMSVARTLAAIGLDYMYLARDKSDKYLKKMKMSPAQREAAHKASMRMKQAWME
jgi:hypothetical protein